MYTFIEISPPKAVCNTLVIRTLYLLHPTLSICLITRKILSKLRIMKLLILQTPTSLRYVDPLKENEELFLELFYIILEI